MSQIHRTTKRTKLEFHRHNYQVGILTDRAQKISIVKSPQCGISELALGRMFYRTMQGWAIFYLLPTIEVRNFVVKERVDPLIAGVPLYRDLLREAQMYSTSANKAADATLMKSLGRSWVIFAGSNSPASLGSHPADVLIVDEYNDCVQKSIRLARKRIDNSQLREEFYLGNPTIKNFGIDTRWLRGDQRMWNVKCNHCGEWQPFDWFINVVRQEGEARFILRASGPDAAIVCRKCDRTMNRYGKGEWVAAFPGRDEHSYHISQLFSGTVPLREMWQEFLDAVKSPQLMQEFQNSRLGISSSIGTMSFTRDLLESKVMETVRRVEEYDGVCYGGIDVGSYFHVIICNERREVIYIAALTSWDELDKLWERFPRLVLCIDALPEGHACASFAARHDGLVYRAWFSIRDPAAERVVDHVDCTVKTNRTTAFDETLTSFQRDDEQGIWLPLDAMEVPDFVAHMTASSRVLDENRQPPIPVWDEGDAADHYLTACVYLNLCLIMQWASSKSIV